MADLLNNFTGLVGPVVDRGKTGFFKRGNHLELIQQSILRIIFTRKGSRMGNLEFGTLVPDLTFSDSALGLTNVLEYEISEAIAKWEPRAEYIGLNILEIDDEYVNFYITYKELITNTVQELPVLADFV